MNPYLAKLGALDWGKVLGIGVLAAGLYYALMFNDGTELNQQIQAAQSRLETAKQQLSETEKALADADRFEKEVQSLARQFEKITDFMPATVTAVDLTSLVNKQAQLAGVRIVKIEPDPAVKRVTFYEMTRVNIELEGTYAQLATFLSYISRVPRLLTFDSTSITVSRAIRSSEGGPTTGRLIFASSMVGYRYLKDAPATTSPGQPGAPGAAPAQPQGAQ